MIKVVIISLRDKESLLCLCFTPLSSRDWCQWGSTWQNRSSKLLVLWFM